MRPTNGEINVAPASAQAAAWVSEKTRVMLQWIPSASRIRHACTPSHVAASLMSTRARDTPRASYRRMSLRALATVAPASNESFASTSVLTRPGTRSRIWLPYSTSSRSTTASAPASPASRASATAAAKVAPPRPAARWAFRISEGFVVASRGRCSATASGSPVSATTTVPAASRPSRADGMVRLGTPSPRSGPLPRRTGGGGCPVCLLHKGPAFPQLLGQLSVSGG